MSSTQDAKKKSKQSKSGVGSAESKKKPVQLAVLISGGGTTVVNLQRRIDQGRLNARIALIIASNDKAEAAAKVKLPDTKLRLVSRKQAASVEEFSDVVFSAVRKAEADLVCLAGFLSLLQIPNDYQGKVINIHPSLLPAFGGPGMYGTKVHEAVLAAGCKVSGCTVHLADDTYDTGPILIQRTCPVRPGDTPESLAARVFEQECEAYPEAIEILASGRVKVDGRMSTLTTADDRFAQAVAVCDRAHDGQSRRGGAPYAEHPKAVCDLVRQTGTQDADLPIAALLHDVVEDSELTVSDLADQFGPRVASIVGELTLSPESETSFELKHKTLAEHAKVMSPGAKLIKLADRRNNLAELHHKPLAKQQRYGKATLGLLEAMKPWPKEANQLAFECKAFATFYMNRKADDVAAGAEF